MGTIRKRYGNYYIDYRLNGRRIRKVVGESKKIADLALAEIKLRIDRVKSGVAENAVADIVFDLFCKRCFSMIGRKTERTRETYLLHFNNFGKYFKMVGGRMVSDVSKKLIDGYINYRLAVVHPNTVNHELDSMRTIFNMAIKMGFVAANPFLNLDRPAVIKRPPMFLSKAEIDALFLYVPERFKPFYFGLLYTGMRVGELLLLRWDDFDLKRRLVYVRNRMNRTQDKMRPRAIPLHERVVWAYRERLALRESDVYVFTTQSGELFDRQVLRKLFKRSVKRAGLDDAVTLHTLRHTFASILAQSGAVTLKQISEWLGHKSVIQTEIYAHLVPVSNSRILDEVF